ncbi:MAG: cytidine deaminase [Proteobacteria bacterium]|nr:cytidine deaminase [Pseudomonadota bacterium]
MAEAARQARENAWVPVTGFRVGAAVRTADGLVFAGCNVEHPVPHEGSCAEKVALYHAVAEGHRNFEAVAVVSHNDPPATPCGSCRQTLDHWGIRRVIVAHEDGRTQVFDLAELLPESFKWMPEPPTPN